MRGAGLIIFAFYLLACGCGIDLPSSGDVGNPPVVPDSAWKVLEQLGACLNRLEKQDTHELITSNPDLKRNVSELITSKGYPLEEHKVTTLDGYILSMQRIPCGKECASTNDKKKPVLCVHGMFGAADNWVLNLPHQSLGFILADAGYDVWLGNRRGNVHSRNHVTLNPDNPFDQAKFWNFSHDEIAMYDLPAMIDYVLDATGEDKLAYIGHSQGTTVAFALLSESPEYNDKIRLFIALAPAVYLRYLRGPVKLLASLTRVAELLLKFYHDFELLARTWFSKYIGKFCESPGRYICEDLLFFFFGKNKKQLIEERLGVYFAHYPAGSSEKPSIHYGQFHLSAEFQKYDYRDENMEIYGQVEPPVYDVSRITTPTALFWSCNDWFATRKDVATLVSKMNPETIARNYMVPDRQFTHLDFQLARNASALVHKEVLSLLEKECHFC